MRSARQLEARGGLGARRAPTSMPRSAARRATQRGAVAAVGQVDGRERAERAVVDDVRIGDRQDHARDCPRRASRRARPAGRSRWACRRIRVFAFMPWSAVSAIDRSPCASSLREVAVHHRVERVGAVGARARACAARSRWSRDTSRRGGASAHQLRRRRRTRTPRARRCRPRAPACRPARRTSSMPFSAIGRLVGLLGREADALHAVAEQLAQLVLGGDHGDRLRRRRRARRGSSARAATSGRSSSLRCRRRDVEEVVAADAVHRGRRAGHDRQVVRVGEARDDAVGDQRRAGREHLLQPWHVAVRDRLGEVVGLAAVDADDDDGLLRPARSCGR